MKNVIPEVDSKSMDIVADNISKLKELFPEAFTEGKVDFDALKEVLGSYVDVREERYSFTWNGKSKARMLAQTPSTGTLRPCKEESVDWDTTQNLFIEGDNLEVLKLLQKSYHKKVKMIYIDPPYNTGKDFVYKDNFQDNIRNYKEITGQVDGEGRNLSSNPETSGRYHTDWLNMMYPRLKLARNLLKDDGVIFISIDDNESSNIRRICDEVFGEDNLRGTLVWQHSIQPKGYSGTFSVHHNFIFCYAKSDLFSLKNLPRTDEHNKNYSNPDNDPNGPWRAGDVRNALFRPNLIYKIETPSGKIIEPPEKGWRWSRETLDKKISTGEIVFSNDETRIIRKIYLNTLEGRTPETLLLAREVGSTRDAANEIKILFDGRQPFDTPKPVGLIEHLIFLSGTETGDVLLDFFAGSSTTAHSVIKHNAENNETAKYIMVQLPEMTDEESEAFKAGYKTISDISKERIRRAAAKIKDENPDYQGDFGFKVFKLDSTNIKPWELGFDLTEQDLEDQISNIKHGREDVDVLYEVLLKYGLDLTLPITEHIVAGHKVFDIGLGALMICLSDDITLDVVEGIATLKDELKPEIMRVVFKDAGFADDVVKTNAVQILKQAGIEDVRSL